MMMMMMLLQCTCPINNTLNITGAMFKIDNKAIPTFNPTQIQRNFGKFTTGSERVEWKALLGVGVDLNNKQVRADEPRDGMSHVVTDVGTCRYSG